MRKWLPLLAICLGMLMLMVDGTIVIVALPVLADDLHASFTSLEWVIDAYALTLAALLMTAGALADRFGRRRVYLIGLVTFAATSLCCALAPDGNALVAARAVQGIGGAAMFATTMALLNATYTGGRDRGIAFGVWGAVAGASASAGPILGGLITEYLNWQSIFLVNLPICVIAVLLTRAVVAESRNPRPGRLDLPGMLTFTLAAASLTYAFTRAPDHGWASPGTLALFATAAAALVAFVVVESRRRSPMLDLSLFRNRSFSALLATGLLMQAAAFGYLTYSSLWLQSALGYGPVRAGLTGSLALSAAGFVVSAVGGRFLHNVSPRLPVGLGVLVLGIGDLVEARLPATATGLHLIPGLIIAGIGMGLALPVLSSAIMGTAPHHRAGMASGALNTFRQLGMALGIAVLGAVFRAGLRSAVDSGGLAAALAAGRYRVLVAQHAVTESVARRAFTGALHDTLLVAAGIAVVAAGLTLGLVSRPRATENRLPRKESEPMLVSPSRPETGSGQP